MNSPKQTAAARRAVELAGKHLQLNPDDARAFYLGGAALMELGEVERATEWCNRALAIDPDDARLQYNMACLYSIRVRSNKRLSILKSLLGSVMLRGNGLIMMQILMRFGSILAFKQLKKAEIVRRQ